MKNSACIGSGINKAAVKAAQVLLIHINTAATSSIFSLVDSKLQMHFAKSTFVNCATVSRNVTLPNNGIQRQKSELCMLHRLNILSRFLPRCQLLIAVEVSLDVTSPSRSAPSPLLVPGRRGWGRARGRALLSVRSELPTGDTRRDNGGRGHSGTSAIKLGYSPADVRAQRSKFARGRGELTADVIPLMRCQNLQHGFP